jgi:hypothetical protein
MHLKAAVPKYLINLITLKYSEFKQMINELNSIAEYFLDQDGYGLLFNIQKGTDFTFLWKITVRIECSKVIFFLVKIFIV